MPKVRVSEAKRFIADCLKAAGANGTPAKQQAILLAYADTIGHKDCGLNQLDTIVRNIKRGACKPNNLPKVIREMSSTAWVDAKNVMGATAGCFAMNMAIKKANDTGVGWIAIKGSCYNCKPYSFWSHKAADAGLIGMVFSNNASETQSQLKKQTTNNKVQDRTKNKDSCAINEYREVSQFTPSRGSSPTSKLAALVEMISGTGQTYDTKNSNTWLSEPLGDNLGHCFVVVNPACFALGFNSKLVESLPHWKQQSMNQRLLEIPLVNLEKKMSVDTNDTDVITYEPEIIAASSVLAKILNVRPLCYLEAQQKLQ